MAFRKYLLLVIICCSINQLNAQVKAWEENENIPTWEIGAISKYPLFKAEIDMYADDDRVYPYPIKAKITQNKIDKNYISCYLENEFIKLLVTPEIGGKLYGAKDKTNDYNFFYWQPTVKPALISLTGAWTSGGIEWCFPSGHRQTTFSPVSYSIEENDDSSKTIWVGETEWVHGLRWIVGVTIYPGKSIIEAKVRLQNPTELPQSYYMWAIAATNANEDYQLIYPTKTMTGHNKFKYSHWPIDKGVDVSWWKNIPNAGSMFSTELSNYFGGYDHGKNAGTVFLGNKHIVVGKKFWTWGTSPFGRMWDWILSDGEGPYAEPQAGGYSDNQPDFHWLQPGEVKSYSHFFFPVKGIDGFKKANINGALNFTIVEKTIKISAYSTSILKSANIVLKQKNESIYSLVTSLDPGSPFSNTIVLEKLPESNETFFLALYDENGNELISYKTEKEEKAELPTSAKVYENPEEISSNDELWVAGDFLYKNRDLIGGISFFEELLKRDSLDTRANISMALIDISMSKYKSALIRLNLAYQRDKDNGDLYYLRGVAYEAVGNLDEAYNSFYRSVHFQEYLSRAYQRIVSIDIKRRDYTNALIHVDKAIEQNTLNAELFTLKSLILRLDGQAEKSIIVINKALKLDPLSYWAMYQKLEGLKSLNISFEEEKIALKKLLINDYQYYAELISKNIELGQYQSAMNILGFAASTELKMNQLLIYYKGYILDKLGMNKKAIATFKLAREENSDYVFPFRRREIKIFETALKYDSQDFNSEYYLGLIYAGILNGKQAIKHFDNSVNLNSNNAKSLRNLGFLSKGYLGVESNLKEARNYYERANKLVPNDSEIMWEYVKLRKSLDENPADILSFLEKNSSVVENNDGMLTYMLDLQVHFGKYENALKYYNSHVFNNREGRYTIHNSYMAAYIGMAKSAKSPEQAIDYYLKAGEYPNNLRFKPREPNFRGFLYYPMSKLHREIGNIEKADSLLSVSLEEATTLPTLVTYYKVLSLIEINEMDKAENLFKIIEDEANSLIDGKIEGYFTKSIEFRKALGLYYLSLVYDYKNMKEEAISKKEEAISIYPLIERDALVWAQIKMAGTNQ